jgi:malonate-semialdehyde dehydrogenase (acetylating)/methylmalonate-semialdehyde dehydrogenase
MAEKQPVLNYIAGDWMVASGDQLQPVFNPATGEVLAEVPLAGGSVVDQAATAAAAALLDWRNRPAGDRIQILFELRRLLDDNFEDLAHTITLECGKTLDESKGELRRAIENVEVACGIPTLLQGEFSEDIASGIDETMIRQPVGVCAIVSPFNFPGMIPFWFMPYAIACGNTVIVKPSEKVPLTMQRVFELVDSLDLPAGVVNLVNGGPSVVDAIIEHPEIKAISFVGSSKVAKHVYAKAAAHGKRVQAQGGAKNPIIVMPDADLENATRIVADSAFGCAGQRCLAASLAIAVAEAGPAFEQSISEVAGNRVVGSGMDPNVEMGPVIRQESRQRIEGLIAQGEQEGGHVIVDGRGSVIRGHEGGYFIRPTVVTGVLPGNVIARDEIFGPVLGLVQVESLDEALSWLNAGDYGNMACLFTSSGEAARRFRHDAQAGNVGINVGVAAPMAFFPFSGWKDSFFGDLHGQGKDAVEFFTRKKVVVERWPVGLSRRF